MGPKKIRGRSKKKQSSVTREAPQLNAAQSLSLVPRKSHYKNEVPSFTNEASKFNVEITLSTELKQSSLKMDTSKNSPKTSPFKGFENTCLIKENKILGPGPVAFDERDAIFDKLLDNKPSHNLHRNMKTYSNKRKLSMNEGRLLEFRDCKNRDEILKWLNNTQNVFERLTETQDYFDSESQASFDMPSVSQQVQTRVKVNKNGSPKSKYKGFKLRAKSLDIKRKKNGFNSRCKSLSFTEETQNLDNYQIEEFYTEELAPMPAGKVIVNLMEDECLDNLEREILKDMNGWDKLKNLEKSLSSKKPSQLNIVLDKLPEKIFDNNADNLERSSVTDCIKMGKRFVSMMKTLVDDIPLTTFQYFKSELDLIFTMAVDKCSVATQTHIYNSSRTAQTEPLLKFHAMTQTEIKRSHTCVQTFNNTVNQSVQTINETVDKGISTANNINSTHVQNENPFLTKKSSIAELESPWIDRHSSDSQKTSSNLILCNQTDKKNEEKDVFDDHFNVNFNTEEFFKGIETLVVDKDKKLNPEERQENEVESPQSVIFVSQALRKTDICGVKRSQPENPTFDPEIYRSKRPCTAFINEDLAVSFSTSPVHAELVPESKPEVNQDHDPTVQASISQLYQNQITPLQKNLSQNVLNSAKMRTREFDYFNPNASSDTEMALKNSRRCLFGTNSDTTVPDKTDKKSESLFQDGDDVTMVNTDFPEDNVDEVMREITLSRELLNRIDSESEMGKNKVHILENIIVKEKDCEVINERKMTQISDTDFVEATPQKEMHSFSNRREESALDVTLPPPLEFRDTNDENFGSNFFLNNSKISGINTLTSPRRPLSVINKITSTPTSHCLDSEQILSLSPIPLYTKYNNAKYISKVEFNQNQKTTESIKYIDTSRKPKFPPLIVCKKAQTRNSTTPKQQSILHYISSESQKSQFVNSQSFEDGKPCIACSRVDRDQIMAISKLTTKKLATYSTCFSPKVTHLIVSVSERNYLKDHTIKYVSAVAAGIWVLSFGWVKECLMRDCLVAEEPFEVLDVSGTPGPRLSRLTRRIEPLLRGYKVYAAAPFASTTQQEVENVVRLLGGQIVTSPEHLLQRSGYVCVVITEAKVTQDFDLYETWLELLKVVTVDIEWLSRSVGQYKLLSLRPFALCSDDSLDTLGYPPELTVNMTYSFTQQTFSSVPSST